MKNKKADIKTVIIPAVIAIAILAIILLYLYPSTDTFKNFFSWIGFNMTIEPISGIGIVRYDISTAKVMHYDGTEWQDFEEIKFDDKTLKSTSLKKDFENWYYETEKEETTINAEEYFGNLLNQINSYNKNKDNENLIPEKDVEYLREKYGTQYTIDKGTFVIYSNGYFKGIITTKDKEISHFTEFIGEFKKYSIDIKAGYIGYLLSNPTDVFAFILHSNNEFGIVYSKSETQYTGSANIIIEKLIYKEIPSYNKGTLLTIYNTMKNWRDNIFSKPIPIKIDEKNTKYYCTQLWDNKFAVIYLDKEVKENKCILNIQ